MAHKHSIYDSDLHFAINPITRSITNMSPQKTTLIQYDHNSERFTFELPRYVEGHDMSVCDSVEIHYLNIDAVTKQKHEGVYDVTDLQISPDDENVVICSWLISQNATQLIGPLNFLVRFVCATNGVVDYVWSTAIFSNISISTGIYNGEIVIEPYIDILEQWRNIIESNIILSLEQTKESDIPEGENVWTATFGNNTKSEFKVKNGKSMYVEEYVESTEDGGSNVMTLSDGTVITVKNGNKGSTGDNAVWFKGLPDNISLCYNSENTFKSGESLYYGFLMCGNEVLHSQDASLNVRTTNYGSANLTVDSHLASDGEISLTLDIPQIATRENVSGIAPSSVISITMSVGGVTYQKDIQVGYVFDGVSGKDGTNGEDGTDGKDGYSPYIETSYTPGDSGSAGYTEVVIVQEDGDVKFIVHDGAKGADGTMTFEDLTDEQKASLKGDPGTDGYSPTVSVMPFEDHTNVVIVDKEMPHSFNIPHGQDGQNGQNGQDGVSVTHTWDGTILTVTSASGTSSANLKGDKGDKGDTGPQGQQGEQGIQGPQGADGQDYVLTDADKEELGFIPDYIVNEAERVAKLVQSVRTAKTLVFPVLTDFHLYDGNATYDNSLNSAKCAGMGVKEIGKYLSADFTALLGDYTWGADTYTAEQIKKDITLVKKTLNLDGKNEFWCIGNHDLNYGSGRDTLLTNDELYGYIGSNSDAVKPYTDIERNYGYKDFDNQKIRIVNLNTCDSSDWLITDGVDAQCEWISPTQLQWVVDTALDFSDKINPAEWGIVFLSHHPINYGWNCFTQLMQLLEAYKSGTSGSMLATVRKETDGTYSHQTVTYDFTTGDKAEIICNIHGHSHNCHYKKISSSDNVDPWLWRICIPNVCVGRENEAATSSTDFAEKYGEFDESGNPVYWQKTPNTAKATSFSIISIDRKNETIYAHTFGVGKDRIISYADNTPSYTNQIPISTDVDGSTYGYVLGSRLGSGGAVSSGGATDGITGFIPCKTGDELYFKDLAFLIGGSNTSQQRISFYETKGTSHVFQTNCSQLANLGMAYETDGDGNLSKLTLSSTNMTHQNNLNKVNFIRLSTTSISDNSIITVNEEIE